MAAASSGNTAAVALLLQRWVAVDQPNKCVLPENALPTRADQAPSAAQHR